MAFVSARINFKTSELSVIFEIIEYSYFYRHGRGCVNETKKHRKFRDVETVGPPGTVASNYKDRVELCDMASASGLTSSKPDAI